jgi:hypothetical protein
MKVSLEQEENEGLEENVEIGLRNWYIPYSM